MYLDVWKERNEKVTFSSFGKKRNWNENFITTLLYSHFSNKNSEMKKKKNLNGWSTIYVRGGKLDSWVSNNFSYVGAHTTKNALCSCVFLSCVYKNAALGRLWAAFGENAAPPLDV